MVSKVFFFLYFLVKREADSLFSHQINFCAVGGTVQACTKGIQLWSQPIKDDKRGVSYIIMDSEGLGSLERSHTFDTQICSLVIVLASLFILNTQGDFLNTAEKKRQLT